MAIHFPKAKERALPRTEHVCMFEGSSKQNQKLFCPIFWPQLVCLFVLRVSICSWWLLLGMGFQVQAAMGQMNSTALRKLVLKVGPGLETRPFLSLLSCLVLSKFHSSPPPYLKAFCRSLTRRNNQFWDTFRVTPTRQTTVDKNARVPGLPSHSCLSVIIVEFLSQSPNSASVQAVSSQQHF